MAPISTPSLDDRLGPEPRPYRIGRPFGRRAAPGLGVQKIAGQIGLIFRYKF